MISSVMSLLWLSYNATQKIMQWCWVNCPYIKCMNSPSQTSDVLRGTQSFTTAPSIPPYLCCCCLWCRLVKFPPQSLFAWKCQPQWKKKMELCNALIYALSVSAWVSVKEALYLHPKKNLSSSMAPEHLLYVDLAGRMSLFRFLQWEIWPLVQILVIVYY